MNGNLYCKSVKFTVGIFFIPWNAFFIPWNAFLFHLTRLQTASQALSWLHYCKFWRSAVYQDIKSRKFFDTSDHAKNPEQPFDQFRVFIIHFSVFSNSARSFESAFFSILDTYSPVKIGIKDFHNRYTADRQNLQ